MTSLTSVRFPRRAVAFAAVTLTTLGLIAATDIVVDTANAPAAEAYWAEAAEVNSSNVNNGDLLDNLMCIDSGVPSGGGSSAGAVIQGVNDLALLWSYPPQAGVTYNATLTLTSDGGTGMVMSDWATANMLANNLVPQQGNYGGSTNYNTKNTACWDMGNNEALILPSNSAKGPCWNNTSATDASTGGAYTYMAGPAHYTGSLPFSVSQNLNVTGLSQARWGIAVKNTTSGTRTFSGTITINASQTTANSGSGGTSSVTWGDQVVTASKQFNWTVTYPSSSGGTGSVSCTLSAAVVDITVGGSVTTVTKDENGNPIYTTNGQHLAGYAGTWVDGDWMFAQALPGESFSREVVFRNAGSTNFTLGATLSTPRDFGIEMDTFSYNGDMSTNTVDTGTCNGTTIDSAGVACNSKADVAPTATNIVLPAAPHALTMRTGTCAAAPSGATRTAEASKVEIWTTPKSILGSGSGALGSGVVIKPGDVYTLCMIFRMTDQISPDGVAQYGEAARWNNAHQGTALTDSAGAPSMSLFFTATPA
ncbi:MAG: hypothetical protein LBH13_06080 [Cellulomonadaceae bacterium]|jgi:hypothetical protein|nr:hypothetical protein [Cellulomonadaceae bacterium]